MKTRIIEATNNEQNWGKFMIGEHDVEYGHVSAIDGHLTLHGRGWSPQQVWVMDLQTREGAGFLLGGLASVDLDKHGIHVCPLFEPFLTWLYAYYNTHNRTLDLDELPDLVQLPDAAFSFAGYRRTGEW